MNDTEGNLLCSIGSGNKAAVSDFIDRYGGLLWTLALRLTRNEADAEDAVQDVFIAIWKSASRFDPTIASEKTFVSMVARRRLIDRNRRKKLEMSTAEVADIVDKNSDAGDQAEMNEEVKKAVRILNQLPDDQSKAIRLSIYGGLSHSQIAAATGNSLGTVKTHIRRGLITMRQRIGHPSEIQTEGGIL